MTVRCDKCGNDATFVDETTTLFADGYFECRHCGNSGRVTDGSNDGNKLNGYREV